MKPEQFIREFGVEKARKVVEYKGSKCGIAQSYSPLTGKYYSLLDGVFYFFSESTNQFLKYADEVSSTLDLIGLSDLNRLVESFDLIEKLGGYGKCKFYMTGMKLNKCDSVKCPKTGLIVSRAALEIAINDYRESIYGGGDA